MSHFIPSDEEDFPQVHTLVDQILLEGSDENIYDIAKEFVPTQFEILENWLEQNKDGFTIRDLPFTNDQIDTLIVAIQRFGTNSKNLFDLFVTICTKPLHETKSNEKLTNKGAENIEQFYYKLTELWEACPVPFKLKMALLFRKMFHAGKNPDELNNNANEESPNSANSLAMRNRVIDKEYIMERMKISGALVGIVREFNFAANLLDYKFGNPDEPEDNHQAQVNSYDQIDDPNANFNSSPQERSPTMKNMTYEEELAFYGVPIPKKEAPAPVAPPVEEGIVPNADDNSDGQSLGTQLEQQQQQDQHQQQETRPEYVDEVPEVVLNKAIMRELSQLMLNLCLDITNMNVEAATILCLNGISDGIITLIDKDFHYDSRDKRISYDIELLWNVIEPFYDKVKLEYENTVVISTKSQPNTPRGNNLPASPGFGGGSFYDDNNSFGGGGNNNNHMSENPTSIAVNYHSFILQHENAQNLTIINLEKAISVFYQILYFLIYDGFRQSDKELRNEIVIILTIFAEFPFAVGHFIHTELLHLLLTYSCVEEIGKSKWPFFLKQVANTRNFATISDSDLELKKLIWNLLTVLCKFNDVDILLSISASPLLPCLLTYLEQADATTSSGGNHQSSVTKNGGGGGLAQTSISQSGFGNGGNVLENSDVLVSKSVNFEQSKTKGLNGFSKSTTIAPAPGGHGGGAVGNVSFAEGTAAGSIVGNNHHNNHNNSNNSNTMTKGLQKKSLISQLTPSKLKEFQVQASLFFVLNGNKFLCEIERLNGIQRIINLLLYFTQHLSESPDIKTIIYNLLIFLYKAVQNSWTIRDYMELNQGIGILLHLFSTCYSFMIQAASNGNSSQNLILEESCSQIIRIISLLCEPNNSYCQEQFQIHNGIKILLQPIKTYVTKRPPIIGLKAGIKIINNADINDPYIDPLDNPFGGEISILIIAIINCFSKSVIGHFNNELAFAELEGLDLLLDILEISPFILRIHILRLLSDILLNQLVIPYIYSWRSAKTLRSASQLICHAWLDEEARLNSERKESNGIICDLLNPLGNHLWPKADFEIPLLGGAQSLSLSLANTASPLLNGNLGASLSVNNPNSTYFLPSTVIPGAAGGGQGAGGLGQSSVIVSKLATAILAGRNAIQTNLPIDISLKVLQSDTRIILSNILQNLRLFEIYQIENEHNPYKPNVLTLLPPTTSQGTNLIDPSAPPVIEDGDGKIIYNSIIEQNNELFTQRLSPQYYHMNTNHDDQQNNQHNHNSNNNNYSSFQDGTESNVHPSNNNNNNKTNPNPSLTFNSTTNINLNNIIHGFDEIKLTPKEKQVLSIAKKYIMLRESDWWKSIYYNLLFQGVIPIESDMALIDMRLEYSFDAAMALQVEQMKLFNENEDLKKQNENLFLEQILTKKNQQIKAEWLKKNAKGGFKNKNKKNNSRKSTANNNDGNQQQNQGEIPSVPASPSQEFYDGGMTPISRQGTAQSENLAY